MLATETEPSIGKLVDLKFIYGHRQAGRKQVRSFSLTYEGGLHLKVSTTQLTQATSKKHSI